MSRVFYRIAAMADDEKTGRGQLEGTATIYFCERTYSTNAFNSASVAATLTGWPLPSSSDIDFIRFPVSRVNSLLF